MGVKSRAGSSPARAIMIEKIICQIDTIEILNITNKVCEIHYTGYFVDNAGATPIQGSREVSLDKVLLHRINKGDTFYGRFNQSKSQNRVGINFNKKVSKKYLNKQINISNIRIF